MMYGLYNGHGGYVGGGLMMFIFWVLFIVFVVWIVREMTGKSNKTNSKPLDILKERYAKGEITKEQFESMTKDVS
jgi:putative membrane protein